MRNLTGLGRNQLIDHIVALENRMSVYEDAQELYRKSPTKVLPKGELSRIRDECSAMETAFEDEDRDRMTRMAVDLIYSTVTLAIAQGLPLPEVWSEAHSAYMRERD